MANESQTNKSDEVQKDFIRDIISKEVAQSNGKMQVHTRFPPEPNGYLHIGHAKSICLNFGLAKDFGGVCNLRFDDTNPAKEEDEYVNSIIEDVKWLGWDWGKNLFFASDYFDRMYELAKELIRAGKAYVCDLGIEETRRLRGTLTEAGTNSPFRDRSVEENLELFEKMKNGDFPDGSKVLRAKIDMASSNMNMRDPVMYRILHATHHRTGDKWCIYPMYDWAHGLEDSFEGITHSVCTLEFEDHRPLYDWFIEQLGIHHPQQIEFARLNLTYTVMSKRKLLNLVEQNYVSGWDDPRMPTISGLRRRGFSPEAIREFCRVIGVNKQNSCVDYALLEHCLRKDLNITSNRVMAVLDPLKIVITNFPDEGVEDLEAVNNPEDASQGSRKVPFSKELYIEREDFMEDPPKKFFRLAPGREVRLRYAYFITCNEVIKDNTGKIIELRCTFDPQTRGGDAPDGRKVKSTLHWVSAEHAIDAVVNIYDHLFIKENPEKVSKKGDFTDNINKDSLKTVNCKLEPYLANVKPFERLQFERLGYFCCDKDSTADNIIFNKTVGLKDMSTKNIKQKQNQAKQKQQKKNKN